MGSIKRKYIGLIMTAVLILALGLGYFFAPTEIREKIDGTIRSVTSSAYTHFKESRFSYFCAKIADKIKDKSKSDKNNASGKDSTNKPIPSATLVGTITDEKEAPIADVSVIIMNLQKDKEFSASTDKEGKYKITNLPEGNGTIVAKHPKFVAMMRPGFPLKAKTTSMVNMTLPIASSISGKVCDEDNKPIPGVKVLSRHISNTFSSTGGEALIYADVTISSISDKDGAYKIIRLPLGESEIVAERPGYERFLKKHILTKENYQTPLNITLKRAGILSGEVRDANGKGLPNAKVTLVKYKAFGENPVSLPETSNTLQTKPDGTFRFEKLFNEGSYDLKVEHPEYAPSFLDLIPAGTQNIVVNMNFGATISGEAILIDRAGTPGASVPVKIETVLKETTFTQRMVTNNGPFKFEKLPFGTYKIWVDDDPFASLPYPPIPADAVKPLTENVKVEVYQISPVSGRVISAENDMPISDATVTIDSVFGIGQQRSMKFTAKTTAMGKFIFEKLPAGQHTAAASAKGYVRTNSGTSAETFFLFPGESKNDLSLLLYRGGTVEGRVLDAAGSAIPKADVQLFVASTNKRNLDTNQLKTKSGDNGWYKITGIDVGEQIQLYASAQATGHAKGMSEIINLTDKKPSAIADIQLPTGGIVQGRVMDENGLPIQGAQVDWSSGNFPGDPSPSGGKVSTESNGSYQIENLPPGNIYLNVTRSGYVSQGKSVSVADKQVKAGVDFKLKIGKSITGIVQTLEGHAIPDANVTATGLSGTQGRDSAKTDKEGRFSLGNLGTGTFRLNATFTKNTPEGGQNYNFYVYPIKSNSEGVLIVCDVDNSASTIVSASGSGTKIQNFSFVLKSNSDIRGQDFSVSVSRNVTNTNGLLKVSNIPLGVYTLEVKADGYETWKNTDIYIGPNTRTTMPMVHLEAAGGICGKVVSDKTNRPINGITVTLFGLPDTAKEATNANLGWKQLRSTSTDYTGSFKINGLTPGTYRVDFSHTNYAAQSIKNIPVSRRRVYDVGTIIMETGGTVTGSVKDETGAPCSGFSVMVSDMNPPRKVTTDRGGNYLLQGLSEGSHTLTVQGAVRGWRPTYTFGTVLVTAGESVSQNFTIGLTANINGQLIIPDYNTASGRASIYPFDENSRVIDWIRYDANIASGRVTLNQVPPGNYFMIGKGSARGAFTIWQNIALMQGDNNLIFQLSTARVSGRTIGAGGDGVSGTSVQMRPIFDAGFLTQALYNQLVSATTSASNGNFSIPYIQPGGYQMMHVNSSGQWIAQPPMSIGFGQQFNNINLPMN